VNLGRLMVLGLLNTQGPMHGHQIRRTAEMTSVETWGGVSVGSLYRELHRMEEEGLVEPVRSEQVGRRPARTVYRITDEGERELRILREQALTGAQKHVVDPVGVALLFGGFEGEDLRNMLRYRQRGLANALEFVSAERLQMRARSVPEIALAVYRRGEVFIEAELAWHEEIERLLAEGERAERKEAE
jgi:DNA-binding PadR family transcriptional regulator